MTPAARNRRRMTVQARALAASPEQVRAAIRDRASARPDAAARPDGAARPGRRLAEAEAFQLRVAAAWSAAAWAARREWRDGRSAASRNGAAAAGPRLSVPSL